MPPELQRRHWQTNEKLTLAGYVASGAVAERTHPDCVPPDLLRELPGRSAESVRQYVRKHFAELTDIVLACDEVVSALVEPPEPPPPSPPPPSPPPPPQKKASKRKLEAVKEPPAPPELVLPLPHAITFGAQRMVFDSHGEYGLMLHENTAVFDDINRKLGKLRDARTEAWDGLPRFL
jgi:hypothetical protein